MALLDVTDLTIGYNTRKGRIRAVEGVSFGIARGQSLGLVGESGCGKTTIGKALMGLLPKNAAVLNGSIFFDGEDLLDISENAMRAVRWNRIAMIFQAAMNALNPIQPVGEQVAEAIHTHRPEMSRAQAMGETDALFDMVGIPENRIRHYPHQYSGGMKQRAIIAMALACKPDVIIADEPTTALDVIVQHQILDKIKMLQKELGISILFISHDISVVADVCHDIGVMYAGQIVEYGRRREVFEAPAHPYTRSLLRSHLSLTEDMDPPAPLNGNPPDLSAPPRRCRFCERCCVARDACRLERPAWIQLTDSHHVLCCESGIQSGKTTT